MYTGQALRRLPKGVLTDESDGLVALLCECHTDIPVRTLAKITVLLKLMIAFVLQL